MLSLYKLEVFNTVAMEGSFSKAAKRLLLSQPAISMHIRDLEASLQAPLFVRSNRGVTLTPAGETLLDYTRCILRMLAEAESAIVSMNKLANSQLAIGATPGAGLHLLPEWIQGFQRRYPGVKVALRTETTQGILSEIQSGRLDIGFIEGEVAPEPPINLHPFKDIDMFVMVGPQHPWWDRKTVTIADLDGEPFITRPPGSRTRAWLDQFFERHDIAPSVIAEFDRPEAIAGAVASGMAITILPDWGNGKEADAKLRPLTIEGIQLRRTLKLAWSDANPFKTVVKLFLSHLVDRFPKLARFAVSSTEAPFILPNREEYQASLGCSTLKKPGK